MSRQKKKGFTLVELVVVLVIMTVILGIAIPSVLHYMKMAEFRKNEENAKTVYLAAESKLTYYRSSGQWEEFKKEVMSQGKEAPFTDSKRKGKIYGITLDKEHDGASASNNAVLGLLDGYTYDKSMLDAMMSAEILGVLSSSQNKDGELDATTSTSILRLAKVAESLKEQQTIYACIQAVPYYQRGSQSTNEYRSSEKVTSNSSNTLYGDDSTENKIKVAYFRHLSNIRYEEEDMKKEITLTGKGKNTKISNLSLGENSVVKDNSADTLEIDAANYLGLFGEKEVETTERERILIGTDIRRVKRGMGCQKCNNTGYRGRIAIHEILERV
jgi:prepilin-type N-terminal cleavage/methylation domain-containing protein